MSFYSKCLELFEKASIKKDNGNSSNRSHLDNPPVTQSASLNPGCKLRAIRECRPGKCQADVLRAQVVVSC